MQDNIKNDLIYNNLQILDNEIHHSLKFDNKTSIKNQYIMDNETINTIS